LTKWLCGPDEMASWAGFGPRAVVWRPWAKALLCNSAELCNVHPVFKYQVWSQWSGSSTCSAKIFWSHSVSDIFDSILLALRGLPVSDWTDEKSVLWYCQLQSTWNCLFQADKSCFLTEKRYAIYSIYGSACFASLSESALDRVAIWVL